VIVNIAVD